jgi:hypothetical protein
MKQLRRRVLRVYSHSAVLLMADLLTVADPAMASLLAMAEVAQE